ncbi:DsrE family protein [Brevibacterium casei]|nr:hypothetical protein [Brevibacterium casei]MCT1549000.1 hypothetical protein [Brevibacterium casei]MCT1558933.1 hypothetical protein [Brevibacterium casei]MCT2207210.1 hypothetical protein [Brevibacterium casei]SMX94249.1 Intracellular sulfur oxidation protein, DsrE/DsrF family [Brevibacterium casei CIP 102111]
MAHQTSKEVILHASDEAGDVQRAIEAANTLRATDPELEARIIVTGPALSGLTGHDGLEIPEGVQVEACRIGMGRRGIAEQELRPSVQTTPSAVVTIVQAQSAGAAYVRI